MQTVILMFLILLQVQEPELLDKKWTLTAYDDPNTLKRHTIPEAHYRNSCKFKVIVVMDRKRNTFFTSMNEKMLFKGKYKRRGNAITIYPRIIENIVDTDNACHVTTESRLVVEELLRAVKSYEVRKDSLIFSYDLNGKQGAINFIQIE